MGFHILADQVWDIGVDRSKGFPRVFFVLEAAPGDAKLVLARSSVETMVDNTADVEDESLDSHVLTEFDVPRNPNKGMVGSRPTEPLHTLHMDSTGRLRVQGLYLST
jgi:hypothetical protein